ncbi:MAG: hypothetical protein IK130_10650 [Oscillospiraceae bacterium]|nr:hypothetical protein [Oscillospiraceae bacterium]
MHCPYCGTSFMGMICPNCNQKPGSIPTPQPSPFQHTKTAEKKAFRPGVILVVLIGFVLVALGALYAFRFLTGYRDAKENAQRVKSSTRPAAVEQTPPSPKETGRYEHGDYEVGQDIPSGLYLIEANEEPVPITINKSANEEDDNLLPTTWYHNNQVILLEKGQFLHCSWCTLVSLDKNKDIIRDPFTSGTGMFIVGRDVEPGKYYVEGHSEHAYYEISDKPICPSRIVRKYGRLNRNEKTAVTLEEGEVIDLTDCTLSKDGISASSANTNDKQEHASFDYSNSDAYFPSGKYEAGKDLPEGLYLILPDLTAEREAEKITGDNCTSESSRIFYLTVTDNGRKIINNLKTNSYYVQLEKGQTVEFSHAYMIDVMKNSNPLDPFTDSGMYIVGDTPLPEGMYKTVRSDDGYSCITVYDKLPLEDTKPLEVIPINDSSQTIELKSGTIIVMEYCHLAKS